MVAAYQTTRSDLATVLGSAAACARGRFVIGASAPQLADVARLRAKRVAHEAHTSSSSQTVGGLHRGASRTASISMETKSRTRRAVVQEVTALPRVPSVEHVATFGRRHERIENLARHPNEMAVLLRGKPSGPPALGGVRRRVRGGIRDTSDRRERPAGGSSARALVHGRACGGWRRRTRMRGRRARSR